MTSALRIQSKNLKEINIQQANVDDMTALLNDDKTRSELDYTSDADDTFNMASTIDEVMDNINIGLFHYLIVITCGLCFSGSGIYFQLLGLITITACDLNINTTNKGWLSLSFVIGIIPGTILFGGLADIHGRRKVLLFVIFLALMLALVSAFAYNYVVLTIMTGLIGSSYGGMCAIVHSYAMEFFPRRYRGIAGACVTCFKILGSVYSCVIALIILPSPFHIRLGCIYFTNWRLYLLLAMIPTFVGCCMLFFMPHSLRFVLNKQDNKSILLVLDKIDRINSCYPCSKKQSIIQQSQSINSVIIDSHYDNIHLNTIKNTRNQQNQSIRHVGKLMTQPWRKRLLLLCLTWFGYCFSDKGFLMWLPTVLSYYVSGQTCRHNHHNADHNISMNMTYNISANRLDCYSSDNVKTVIINLLIGNIQCIPLTLLCILLINRVGRKLLFTMMGFICGLNLLLICITDTMLTTTIFSCIFMSFASTGWIPLKIWTLELFSTDIRSTVTGILNVVGYTGCILGITTFILLFDVNCTATFIIFGSIALLAVVATLFLPDTTDANIG